MNFQPLQQSLVYLIGSTIAAFLWAPLLTKFLYKYNITRRGEFDPTLQGERRHKAGTPTMGGLLVIVTVTVITVLFNWQRRYTYVPIGAMGIAALLGAADDLLNIFGTKRRLRNVRHTIILMKVHKRWYMKLWYALTIPWIGFRDLVSMFGSKQGRGIQVHEKLLLQFGAGAVTAWWVYVKLGASWQTINFPFDGSLYLGWFIIPVIIFFVMFTANAVNVADGMDGLAGGSLIAAFLGLTVVSWVEGRTAFAPLNATVVGALLAYTYFNVKPARFQMGDVGSLGLGTLLAINAIALNKTLLIPFFGFIFYVEIFSVILQVLSRRLFGRRLFKMSPLHHHFEIMGWNEEKVVMRFWIIQAFMVMVGVWLALN
ncbi:MAG: phospho-N-acetylmuramoyl-pentapeptide-transferase [Candidatus Magasanikbacteria bacterium]|nr:phospho-N-acetylmuramoyl-pentapeptide-transferase [Candidatus Magasanikbacteria bacterium]